jgi:ankyrin repeat protein
LILAAKQGDLKAVELLVKWGALVEAEDAIGMTAAMWASQNGYTDVVEFLSTVDRND